MGVYVHLGLIKLEFWNPCDSILHGPLVLRWRYQYICKDLLRTELTRGMPWIDFPDISAAT